ncbi:MAG TPA: Crp/Fnr family transcriptional regulator [Candidatus Tumulicola sp.]
MLPPNEAERLRSLLTFRDVPQSTIVYNPVTPLDTVYFPTTCVLSAVTIMLDGTSVEIGTIGHEGFGAVQTALHIRRIPGEMICQVAGESYVMDADSFEAAVETMPGLRMAAFRYLQSLLNLMSQSIACNRLHGLLERCARWLLMTRDRAGSDSFYLTQEFLAYMLGVRRSGVSIAAGSLAQAGFIRYRRGHIIIIDGPGLESASCECYRVVRDRTERLMRGEDEHHFRRSNGTGKLLPSS